MGYRLSNYLRTHRKRSYLTQKEVAFLLNLKSGQMISRHERFLRTPSLRSALSYQVIFGSELPELFAGLYLEVEEQTIARIRRLKDEIGEDALDAIAVHKLEFLQQAIERADERYTQL